MYNYIFTVSFNMHFLKITQKLSLTFHFSNKKRFFSHKKRSQQIFKSASRVKLSQATNYTHFLSPTPCGKKKREKFSSADFKNKIGGNREHKYFGEKIANVVFWFLLTFLFVLRRHDENETYVEINTAIFF